MLKALNSFRNRLYDLGILRQDRTGVPVVSIGNLTMGGTGKTPMIDALLGLCREVGLSPGVVSRGYGADSTLARMVDIERPFAARAFGDEPVLLKSLHPSVPIAVGVRKIDAARLLLANHRVDLLLADDAFQHRALYRDKDLVVLDATAAPSDYLDVPWGRAREGFSSLKRADYLVLSKWNRLQPPEQTLYLDWLRDQGAEELVPRSHWIYLNYTWRGFYDLRRRPRSFSKRPRVFAVSGLARPASFWNLVGEHSDVEEQHSYRDHHDYSAGDVEYLAERCRQRGFDAVVITEKDAVKIRDLVDPSRFDLFVVAGLLAEGDGPGWGGLRDDLAALAL